MELSIFLSRLKVGVPCYPDYLAAVVVVAYVVSTIVVWFHGLLDRHQWCR